MKFSRISKCLLRICSVVLITLPVSAQNAEKPVSPPNEDRGQWPRSFETSSGYEVAIHEPQVHEWPGYQKITMRAAVAVKPKGGDDESISYGALTVEATTTVDKEKSLVFLGDRSITALDFPNAPDSAAELAYMAAVNGVLNPTRPLTISLDRIITNLERTERQNSPKGISMDPPPIFFSSDPAILVIFLGPAKFEKIDNSPLFFGANTNWDVFLDPSSSNYYLLAGTTWVSSKDVMKGPWVASPKLPAAIVNLPKIQDWQDVLAAVPPMPGPAPKVFVSDRPSELILTEGKPAVQPIPGTKILYLSNSESDLFMLADSYYFLTAGRWFTSKKPEGPWTSAMDSLPKEFATIPEDHPKSDVLASVPGTPDAEEAMIAAGVPQTATVNRKDATLEVKYEGDPKFVGIENTSVQYAVNSPNDVFAVEKKYYCCEKGVWFEAPAASGPWMVCSDVPDAIYSIPASSPKHNVTYVNVYESNPETVTVGYTSGYSGAYVAGDLLVFGAGLWLTAELLNHWDDHYHHCSWHYHSSHYSYGCGARYSWHHGGYYRHGYRAYGPYGGAGYGAVYNPWTGGYARAGRVYGPRGTAFAREAYNPWTNTYGARVGASTPYGSWGRSVVVRDDDWARAGHRSGARGSVKGFETSNGSKGIKVNRRFGNDTFLGKSKNDDMYVGRDGKLYRRDSDGNWDKLQKGGWDNVDRPDRPGTGRPGGSTDRPTTRPRVPTERPTTRPGGPTERPTTRPTAPADRPKTRPIAPSDRPTTRPSVPTRPTTQPTTRPTTRPSTRPTTRESTSRQLQRDHNARLRTSTRSTRTRSSGGRSRGR